MRKKRKAVWKLLMIVTVLIPGQACKQEGSVEPEPQSELQKATVRLTETIESEHFIFHFVPGDGDRAEVERMEAYHRWAMSYLGLQAPKRIDYYMFPSSSEIETAFGYRFGGRAFFEEFAVATAYSWHNHECFHLYTCLIGNPPRLFAEGMPVAHEFDPYNDVWISQWNRAEPYLEPYLIRVRQAMEEGLLYPLESLLESVDFNQIAENDRLQQLRVAYDQSGVWVSYLIETYGLEKMKQIVAGLPYDASKETIQDLFFEIYGLSMAQAETDWLTWLAATPRNEPLTPHHSTTVSTNL